MEQQKAGVIFCAGGKARYIDEARFAARSVKKYMPDLPIALFTDQPVKKGREFNFVFESHDYDHPQKLKMHGMLHSPFERTLYLDSDTLTQGDFTELFGFLDFYDIGITHTVKCHWPPYASAVFIDYIDYDCFQGGFLLFRNSVTARIFIQEWHNRFIQVPKDNEPEGSPLGDQPILNEVYKEQQSNPELSFVFLPNFVYNARPWMWEQLKKDGIWSQTKILHAHGLNTPLHLKVMEKIKHRLTQGIQR